MAKAVLSALEECQEEGVSVYFPNGTASTYFYGPAQVSYLVEHAKSLLECSTEGCRTFTKKLKDALLSVWIKLQSKRKAAGGRLNVSSVTLNHSGDPTVGSVHFHTSAEKHEPASQTFQPAAGIISAVGVMVPSEMNQAYTEVTLQYTDPAGGSLNGVLWAIDRGNPQIFGDSSSLVSIPSGGSATVRLPLSSNILPSGLNVKRNGIWELNCPELDTPFLINCDLTVYTLLHAPKTPWCSCTPLALYQAGNNDYITAELLDFAVQQEQAAAGEEAVCSHITNRLYTCTYFTYSGGSSYTLVDRSFKYMKFIRDIANGAGGHAPALLNCTDCATICSSLAAMVGVRLRMLIIKGYNDMFKCNAVRSITTQPAGSQWDVPFRTFGGGFSYHQVNTDDAVGGIPVIYDACLMVDDGLRPGEGWLVTHVPKLAVLPCRMAAQETLEALVSVAPGVDYLNHYYRERLVANGEVAAFLQGKFDVPAVNTVVAAFSEPLDEQTAAQLFKAADEGGYGEHLSGIMHNYFPDRPAAAESYADAKSDSPAVLYSKLGRWDMAVTEEYSLEKTYRLGNGEQPFSYIKEYPCVPGQSRELMMCRVLSFFSCGDIRDLKDQYGDRSFAAGAIIFLRGRHIYVITAENEADARLVAETMNCNLLN